MSNCRNKQISVSFFKNLHTPAESNFICLFLIGETVSALQTVSPSEADVAVVAVIINILHFSDIMSSPELLVTFIEKCHNDTKNYTNGKKTTKKPPCMLYASAHQTHIIQYVVSNREIGHMVQPQSPEYQYQRTQRACSGLQCSKYGCFQKRSSKF